MHPLHIAVGMGGIYTGGMGGIYTVVCIITHSLHSAVQGQVHTFLEQRSFVLESVG